MRSFYRAQVPPSARTLDPKWYRSAEVFAGERRAIFSRSWTCIGRSEQIALPGEFFLATLDGESLIVTRDAQARARAFYNVCRHRGTQLCQTPSGRLKGAIQCPYHAWTYALDGRLIAARNTDAVQGFDPAQFPLHEAHLRESHGFLFATLETPEGFEETFVPFLQRFEAWRLAELRSAKRITYDLQCNWKLIFQNYSECYHCPIVHPQLERLSPNDSGRNDLCDGPFLGGYSTLRENATSMTATGATARKPLPGLPPEEYARVYYYTVFPSLLLSLHPDYVMIHYVQPLASDRTLVTCEWLFDETAMAQPGFDASDATEFWDLTNRQDWHVNELTQAGLASRACTSGPYSQQEGLLHAFDRYYLKMMEQP